MKERPILFSAPMVRAILDGSKTQTRRVVKPQPERWETARHAPGQPSGDLASLWGWQAPNDGPFIDEVHYSWPQAIYDFCPYGQPGDRLWVPDADGLLLEIVDVRAERLQAISEDDAKAEGAWPDVSIVAAVQSHFKVEAFAVHPSLAFRMLWEQLKGASSWDANPWVWVVEFKRVPA